MSANFSRFPVRATLPILLIQLYFSSHSNFPILTIQPVDKIVFH
jgi:hypothetical protein